MESLWNRHNDNIRFNIVHVQINTIQFSRFLPIVNSFDFKRYKMDLRTTTTSEIQDGDEKSCGYDIPHAALDDWVCRALRNMDGR